MHRIFSACFTRKTSPSEQAHGRNRTGDLFLTKEVLYRLSYMGEPRGSAIICITAALSNTKYIRSQAARGRTHPDMKHMAERERQPWRAQRQLERTAVLPRKRAMGVEPTQTAWKAVVLPLHHARNDCASQL